MGPFFLSIAAAAALAPVSAPAPAPAQAATADPENSANMLGMRVASMELRIDMLSDRGAISRAEAQELRQRSRALERRLHGVSARDVEDLATELGRLELRLSYARDDPREPRHVFDSDSERHVGTPYQGSRRSDYRNFDRYTAPPVDRWHDPFDRGSGL